ncbi:MAG: hypothetical protein Hals2KO_15500 [Halioglobus sp.]
MILARFLAGLDDKALVQQSGGLWIAFSSAEEIEILLSQNGFSIVENMSLANLNSVYFTPVGRALPEERIMQLEHFVVAKFQAL